MEYPPLVAGRVALFAVHLTRLGDFTPLTAGRPRIEFTPEGGGAPTILTGSEPSRPGAFRVEGAPPPPGRYRWALLIDAPALADRHQFGVITVFADEQTANAEAEQRPPEDPAAIAYLKEQQWTNEFATAQVREVELRTGVRVPATIEPLSGGEAIVAAPAPGRFMADALVSVGATVGAGQPLGRLEPRSGSGDDRATLASAVAEALAVTEAPAPNRIVRNACWRIVPSRHAESRRRDGRWRWPTRAFARPRPVWRSVTKHCEAGAALRPAMRSSCARQSAAASRRSSATLGASYDEGAPLFRIVRTDRVELQAQVPAADAALSRDIAAVAFEIPGVPDPVAAGAAPRPRRRRDRFDDPGAARADRGRQPGRPPARRPDRDGGSLSARPSAPAGRARALRFCWKRGGLTCSCKAAASGLPADTSRSPLAMATRSASRAD